MPVYIVTGKLGSGKTLACVGRIRDALRQGRRVATNLDMKYENFFGPFARNINAWRLPDNPTIADLKMLPKGYDGNEIDENKNGVMVLDECGTWLNARDWNAAGRKEVFDFCLHIRKMRWDVYFIIQDIEILDKQFRKAFAEHVVYCRRMDRTRIKFLSPLLGMFGIKLTPPKIHLGHVFYGDRDTSPKVETWKYLGKDLYDCYDTEQIFSEQSQGTTTMLAPARFATITPKEHRLNEIKAKVSKVRNWFFAGILTGATVSSYATKGPDLSQPPQKGMFSCNDTYKALYGDCSSTTPIFYDEKGNPQTHKDKPGNENSIETKPKEPEQLAYTALPQPLVKGLYIAGAMASSRHVDYIFEINGRTVYPQNLGISIKPKTDCYAILSKGELEQEVYCKFDSPRELPLIERDPELPTSNQTAAAF